MGYSEIISIVVGFFIDKILNFAISSIRKMPSKQELKEINKYEKTMQSEDFIKYQEQVLENYYGLKYFTKIFDHNYPVFTIAGNVKYPFDNLVSNGFDEDKHIAFKKKKYYRKYKRVIGRNIRRPHMQGFMLDKFILNQQGQIEKMNTWVGTYDENVYTSHILEYEIFHLYNQKVSCDNAVKKMILRNNIHKDGISDLEMTKGSGRASLLGVQLLIVYKTKYNKYEVVTIKRSNDVAARPGFYQFVPSGGFEVFENSDEHGEWELKQNYNVLWAIYREYIEELFGIDEYEYGKGGETIAKIEKEAEIKRIEEYINNKEAYFEFLGSVVDLCGLRHELSFVLRIDNPDYEGIVFKSNSESKKINRIPIENIDKLDAKKINPPSAALWYLFTQNHLYKEINENAQMS